MNRQQKESAVQVLQNEFHKSESAFVVAYKGLSVSQLQSLRAQLREQKGSLKIAKARLMKRAVQELDGVKQMGDHFKDQIGLVFVGGETPAIAKILHKFSTENAALQLVAGCVDSRIVGKADIVRIAQLPSKEVLLGQICGGIKAPAHGLVGVMHTSVVRLLWVLQELQKRQQS